MDAIERYAVLAKLAEEKGADQHKLMVAVAQLMRMEGTKSTIDSVMGGNFSMARNGISLDDRSDPNRSQFSYLYQFA